ncbi:hypothetical protein CEXT_138891 [Caerostris extrusa]|uniref:Uncharacterized protein n=1 Tax=Caerostris extrusa TaxID=172846 RepID=A0AAV4MMU3_CAEEX|nr:hypothetical protein CEXT_138891 [Caerostris extrusa]
MMLRNSSFIDHLILDLGPPSPRMNGPRVFQFQNPQFMEPRMRFPSPGPPLNDMRMPGPHFHDNRPPLIPFHSHRERSPFNPLMFEPNHPPFRMQGSGFPPMRRGHVSKSISCTSISIKSDASNETI